MNISVLKFTDSSHNIDEVLTYYVKKDGDFDNKIIELENLVNTYETYQDIEDYITENFEEIVLDTYDFEY